MRCLVRAFIYGLERVVHEALYAKVGPDKLAHAFKAGSGLQVLNSIQAGIPLSLHHIYEVLFERAMLFARAYLQA